ncbi:polysaccharide deacetylase family protein [Neobacillus sp. CF12]|uniref:polysaccharide deacetylase family protein n=1 Tax=Neobacillus sp. CF12 TaxID=3055864 RepID=UPI00259FF8BF|nr:polysaccharide deacetylase family protein [Neobacillus sp. CF12]MDM5329926.1 polysaccharide deacetylase family protein [Neobacillus sp. CF12]
MKKYAISNLLFTVLFIVIFSPLCYFLFDYVVSFGMPPVAAKQSLSETNTAPISVNRDFSFVKEYADKVPVLMYHQIIPESQLEKHHYTEDGDINEMVVTLEEFTEQMDYLKEQDYTVLSLKEFEGFMSNQKKVPAKSVLITFDDGFKNVFEFAYPVLKKHKFNAVHFLITGLITDRTVVYDSSFLQYASIGELKEASDVFDYGNHTHSFHHRDDSEVSYVEAYDRLDVKEDISKAKEWLGRSESFAAPYGEYDTTTLDILKELKIKMAFTVEPGYADPTQHILEIPRYAVYPFYSMEDFIYILEKKIDVTEQGS